MDAQRRRLWRGGSNRNEFRPPWLHNPETFTSACTRCGHCIALCPEKILTTGDGGFPRVDFSRGGCTLCGACTLECEANLFGPVSGVPWRQTAQVSAKCLTQREVMCRSCEDSCETDALKFRLTAGRPPAPVIDATRCTGCGACVAPCPEGAITIEANH